MNRYYLPALVLLSLTISAHASNVVGDAAGVAAVQMGSKIINAKIIDPALGAKPAEQKPSAQTQQSNQAQQDSKQDFFDGP